MQNIKYERSDDSSKELSDKTGILSIIPPRVFVCGNDYFSQAVQGAIIQLIDANSLFKRNNSYFTLHSF